MISMYLFYFSLFICNIYDYNFRLFFLTQKHRPTQRCHLYRFIFAIGMVRFFQLKSLRREKNKFLIHPPHFRRRELSGKIKNLSNGKMKICRNNCSGLTAVVGLSPPYVDSKSAFLHSHRYLAVNLQQSQRGMTFPITGEHPEKKTSQHVSIYMFVTVFTSKICVRILQ